MNEAVKEVREGQFVITRGWGEFSLSSIRADVVTAKLVKQRLGVRYGGKPSFQQVRRDDVLLVCDTAEEADALIRQARIIKSEFNALERELRDRFRERFNALLSKATGEAA